MLVKEVIAIAAAGARVIYYNKSDLNNYVKIREYSKGDALKEKDANAEVIDIYADNGVNIDAVYT